LLEGARGGNILTIGAICFIFEAILLSLTASGLLWLTPSVTICLRWAGLAFLVWCALRAAHAVLYRRASDPPSSSNASSLAAALVVSVANPLLWVETVLLTGGVAMKFTGLARGICVMGALTATALRIFGISYGVRLTNRRLRGAMMTSVASAVIATVMLGYAGMLFVDLIRFHGDPPQAVLDLR
jgi:L-lysine exporter family protein LysE/ArgO